MLSFAAALLTAYTAEFVFSHIPATPAGGICFARSAAANAIAASVPVNGAPRIIERSLGNARRSGSTPSDGDFAAVIYDEPTRNRLRASLDQARQRAASNKLVGRRVAAVRRGFEEFEESLLSRETVKAKSDK